MPDNAFLRARFSTVPLVPVNGVATNRAMSAWSPALLCPKPPPRGNSRYPTPRVFLPVALFVLRLLAHGAAPYLALSPDGRSRRWLPDLGWLSHRLIQRPCEAMGSGRTMNSPPADGQMTIMTTGVESDRPPTQLVVLDRQRPPFGRTPDRAISYPTTAI